MRDVEIAQGFLEAMSARDYDAAAVLLAADAQVVTPDGIETGAAFLAAMRDWPGLDNLDISVRDRVITEEGGVLVSRARCIFTWKESGEVAYEQPAEAHLTIDAEQVVKFEVRWILGNIPNAAHDSGSRLAESSTSAAAASSPPPGSSRSAIRRSAGS